MQLLSRRHPLWPFLPAVLALVASGTAAVLFYKQGGFGGGHGEYDAIIYWLGTPGIQIIIARVPPTYLQNASDFQLVVLFPFAINLVIAAVLGAALNVALILNERKRR